MFKVHVNDGQNEMPSDDICYIIAKEGIFLKKKLGIMESIAPVKNISILESVSASARMNINPIPAVSFAKVIEFFREVHRQYTSEAIVLLFYNESTGKYRILPPKQSVTYGGINYDRNLTIEGYTMVGDIHSHGSMSAFHSGVDDDDENSFDGLHITIGNVADEDVSLSGSIVSNGYRFIVDPMDYILGIKKTVDIDKVETKSIHKIYRYDNKLGKLVVDEKATARSAYATRKFDKRYITTVTPSKRQFNQNWMSLVEKGTYQYVYGRARNYGWGNYLGGNYWGNNYDSGAWAGYRKVGTGKPQQQKPLALPPGKTQVTGIAPQMPDDTIACLTCKYRDQKILLEEEDVFDDVMYKCEKCGIIISEDSDPLECPTCKTDEHLNEITEKELVDSYERASTEELKGAPSSDVPDVIGIYRCYSCKATFPVYRTDTNCPFCQVVLPTIKEIENELACQTYDPQDPADRQGLDEEADKANEEALRQAAAAEELIPDPEKGTIPIPPQKKDESLMQMFKRAFGGKKGGNA